MRSFYHDVLKLIDPYRKIEECGTGYSTGNSDVYLMDLDRRILGLCAKCQRKLDINIERDRLWKVTDVLAQHWDILTKDLKNSPDNSRTHGALAELEQIIDQIGAKVSRENEVYSTRVYFPSNRPS
jgi:hypothetical protein